MNCASQEGEQPAQASETGPHGACSGKAREYLFIYLFIFYWSCLISQDLQKLLGVSFLVLLDPSLRGRTRD